MRKLLIGLLAMISISTYAHFPSGFGDCRDKSSLSATACLQARAGFGDCRDKSSLSATACLQVK